MDDRTRTWEPSSHVPCPHWLDTIGEQQNTVQVIGELEKDVVGRLDMVSVHEQQRQQPNPQGGSKKKNGRTDGGGPET